MVKLSYWPGTLLLYCVLALISTYASAQIATSITINSETRSIYLGDSVVLDIESTGLLDPLDVSLLKQSPDFLRETIGTRIAVIDGKVVEIAIRRMEFIPSKEGTLIYGPLAGEGIRGRTSSGSISVEVNPAISANWQPGKEHIETEISFSKNNPIVGEQIVVDIKLRHKYQIANEHYSIPDFTDFDTLLVYEERRTIEATTDEAEKTWRQIAWRLLLHPKRSGNIDIEPVQWSGTMIKSRSQRGSFDQAFNSMPMQVLAAPKDRPEWWLPATSVQLTDTWSTDVKDLSAGDEIIRTITLTANNILSNQVPNIEPLPSRALTSTQIRSTREHSLNNSQTVATGVFEYRMVAQSPIPVFLDTVRVPWWNTQTNTHEEAILPARRINIGLPDRADLLADLAMNNSGLSRWLFNMRGFARWQPLLIALGTLMALAALFPLLRDGVRRHLMLRYQHRKIRKLEALRNKAQWQTLYSELNKLTNERKLNTSSTAYQNLIANLQQVLFANNAEAALLLERSNICLTFNPPKTNQNEPLVAAL